jgi:hypothetical protein
VERDEDRHRQLVQGLPSVPEEQGHKAAGGGSPASNVVVLFRNNSIIWNLVKFLT